MYVVYATGPSEPEGLGGQIVAEIIEAKPIPLKLRFSEKVTKSFDITSNQRERFHCAAF